MTQPTHRTCGFSLTEIILVMAVLGILAALALTLIPGTLEKARSAGCQGNLRSIGSAAILYAADHGGRLPGVMVGRDENGSISDRYPGQQWDAQLMPYLEISLDPAPSGVRTPLLCPASELHPNAAMNRQLSYAWNVRLVDADPYRSRLLYDLQQPATILLAMDNKILANQPDRNQVTFNAYGNTIYIGNNTSQLRRVPYERHDGRVNVLFADGSVASRGPVSPTNPTPQGIRFYSNGPLSPGTN